MSCSLEVSFRFSLQPSSREESPPGTIPMCCLPIHETAIWWPLKKPLSLQVFWNPQLRGLFCSSDGLSKTFLHESVKVTTVNPCNQCIGAGRETRTPMRLPPADFESAADIPSAKALQSPTFPLAIEVRSSGPFV